MGGFLQKAEGNAFIPALASLKPVPLVTTQDLLHGFLGRILQVFFARLGQVGEHIQRFLHSQR